MENTDVISNGLDVQVGYVVVAYKTQGQGHLVNILDPGNVVICGVTKDIVLAQKLAKEKQSLYTNIMIYNTHILPKMIVNNC